MLPYRTAWLLQMAERAEELTNSTISASQEQLGSMLRSLRSEIQPQNKDDIMTLKNIHLAEVYSRIIQGVMHSLPNASRRTETDANTNCFGRMLEGLVLGDLYHDCLQLFTFNLPRSIMDEVSKYENNGIISRRKVANEHESWHAVYEKTSSYYETTRPIPLQVYEKSSSYYETTRPIPIQVNTSIKPIPPQVD